jgi:restriction endonuclease Mrr
VVQAKRWTNAVGPRTVRELRGSLQVDERGLIISTAEFTRQAVEEAAAVGRAPIGLVGGNQLAELCMKNSIGVETMNIPIYRVDPTRLL